MGLSDKQWVFLQDISLLIQEAQRLGVKLTGGELQRTLFQQKEYIRTGKSKTMNSKHLSKTAIDFFFFIDGSIVWGAHPLVQELGDYWESLRPTNQWGGNWKSFVDRPHFQS